MLLNAVATVSCAVRGDGLRGEIQPPPPERKLYPLVEQLGEGDTPLQCKLPSENIFLATPVATLQARQEF